MILETLYGQIIGSCYKVEINDPSRPNSSDYIISWKSEFLFKKRKKNKIFFLEDTIVMIDVVSFNFNLLSFDFRIDQ